MDLMSDKWGNVLILEKTKMRTSIYLRLVTERHRRLVGHICHKYLVLHIERSLDKHLLNKANAYGLNLTILEKGRTFNYVCLHETDTNRVYLFDKQWAIDNGTYLFFKQEGFEKQIFVSRDLLQQWRKEGEDRLFIKTHYAKLKS